MRLVDTHAHLQHERFEADRSAVLERALAIVDWVVVVGDTVDSSRRAVELAGDRVYATVGIHPHNASDATSEALSEIRAMIGQEGVVALGEIGLDYHYDLSPREQQREVFRRQLEMAVDCRVPVIVHCREAEADAVEIIEPLHKDLVNGIMHCFGGDAGFAEQCLAWGFHISFAGNVTFPKANKLREAAEIVPLERLLVETDSPYLAPQPVRGQRCEPWHVEHTAAFLAGLRGIPVEELAARTSENARRVYGV